MRIGYIVPSLDDTTGWGRWCNDFLRHVRSQGVEPVIFAPPSSRRFLLPDVSDGAAHFVLPELFDYLQSRDGFARFGGMKALRNVSIPGAPLQLVHSLDAHPWGLYGQWLARRHGVPHVLTTHGRYGYIAENRLLDRYLYGRVLRNAARMIAVSDAVKRAVQASFGRSIAEARLSVLQNPVDADQFKTLGDLPAVVPTKGPVMISVTRFTPVKDIVTAVKAFIVIRERIPDVLFYIIGPGNGEKNECFRAVRDLIEANGIQGIHIVGRVTKDVLSAFYRRASLLVHTARTLPDDFEASGLILLEAGLFGLPVVATASGGIPEVVEDGVTGRLVREGDVEHLAGVVVELLSSPDLGRRLGLANLDRAKQRNWSAYCGDQMQIYLGLLPKTASL